jgi:FkbM family methyltransferase
MSLLNKFINRAKEDGLSESLNRTFDFLQVRIKINFTKVLLKIKCLFNQPPVAVHHGKFKFYFNNDGDYEEILYHAHWDKYFLAEKNKIKKFVSNSDVVVDVGANIGLFSLILSDLVGEQGQVYSFEPIPLLQKKLVNNLNLNRIKNVKTFESGIGDKESEIEIYLNPKQSGLSSAVAKPSDNYISQKVKLTTLDNFFSSRKEKVSFIKIDTEGYEPQVLLGAKELISRDKPVIYIELGGDHQQTSAESLRILKELNYKCEADNIDLSKIYAGVNFIAVPKD